MSKFLKNHKKDFIMWGLVLLIFGLIFLIVYYENKDKKHYTNVACNSDINIFDDNINLNKNGISLNSFDIDFSVRSVSSFSNSYWVINEPSPNYYNYYDVSMSYYFISFDMSSLNSFLVSYYNNNVPSLLYFNFNCCLYSDTLVNFISSFSNTYNFSCSYGINSNDDNFVNSYNFNYDIPLNPDYFNTTDYFGFTFSIPYDYSFYKSSNQNFSIAIPLNDRVECGSSSSNYNTYEFYFYINTDSDVFFLDDKTFSDNNYGVLYNDLLNQYASLQNQYNDLNASYEQVNLNYQNVSNNYNNLNSQYTTLNNDYNSLNTTYQQLDSNYQSLLEQYNSLNNENYTFSELFWSLSAVPFGVLSSGFNVNVLGVNLAAIISGLFTAVLLIWIIKKFLR